MQLIIFISSFIMPLTFMTIILYGYLKKIDIYNAFIDGAKDGINIVLQVFPTLVGLLTAIGILRSSGALEFFTKIISPISNIIGFPKEIVPLVLMRLVSSSAATSLLLDIFEKYSPDSFIGRLASIIMYCTETIFYTISIYFMSIKIKKIRYALKAALIANFFSLLAAFYIAKIFF